MASTSLHAHFAYGALNVTFTGLTDNAMLSAITVLPP